MKLRRRILIFLIKRLAFRRISLRGAPLPDKGKPTLYLGFHRNGAVDAWAYLAALDRPVEFMVAAKLLKKPLARLFFWGVEVTRAGDGGSPAVNRRGLDTAVSLLAQGRSFFIFPEGTSSLGPKRLEFMKGAALVAARALKRRPDLEIVPLSIRYSEPTLWGGDVEVSAGRSLADLGDDCDAKRLHPAFTEALEALAPDFESEEALDEARGLAALAPADLPFSKAIYMAADFSEIGELWRNYRRDSAAAKKWRSAAVFPDGGTGLEIVKFLLCGSLVLSAVLFNALPVAFGAYAGRRFPDGPNVILLWKIMAGFTVAMVYAPLFWVICLALGQGRLIAVHIAVTALAPLVLDTARKSAVSLWNLLFHHDLRAAFRRVRKTAHAEFMARLADS